MLDVTVGSPVCIATRHIIRAASTIIIRKTTLCQQDRALDCCEEPESILPAISPETTPCCIRIRSFVAHPRTAFSAMPTVSSTRKPNSSGNKPAPLQTPWIRLCDKILFPAITNKTKHRPLLDDVGVGLGRCRAGQILWSQHCCSSHPLDPQFKLPGVHFVALGYLSSSSRGSCHTRQSSFLEGPSFQSQ